MNLTRYEFEVIKDTHNRGVRLSHASITKLIREVEIAREDVRGIEIKIDKMYKDRAILLKALMEIAEETGTPYAEIAIKALGELDD